jgi:hypothetical protein
MNEPHKIGRPTIENKRITISVRIDPDLLEEVRSIEGLVLTQAVENGLKLVLANETKKILKLSRNAKI